MQNAELLCLLFLFVTIVLLVVAEFTKPARISRVAGLTAILTVLATDYYLMTAAHRGDGWFASVLARALPATDRHTPSGATGGGSGGNPGGGSRGGTAGEGATAGTDSAGGASSGGFGEAARDTADRLAQWLATRLPRGALPTPPDDTLRDCPECPEMVRIPPGELTIGIAATAPQRHASDMPAQALRVWPGFAIARLEISADELAHARIADRSASCPPGNGNRGVGLAASLPQRATATCLTADDIAEYVAWLGFKSGRNYRLPTAAEWEFAARISEAATTRPLHMGGGVAELVADCWPGGTLLTLADGTASTSFARCAHRVVKDGTDVEDAHWRHPSARRAVRADHASPRIGFRVLRDLDPRTSRAGE